MVKDIGAISTCGQGSYIGVMAGLRSIYQDGGILAFFRGNFANCLKIVPESATKFYAYRNFLPIVPHLHGFIKY